ncbi:indoleamine 2,3-dioxygenase 2-like [Argopecten irradians]|uniref:indoleamine 2,3-dioxygenase 2-like n=1 Tax=Argopecten irradians TaxID=31199 RepID=UPI003712816E
MEGNKIRLNLEDFNISENAGFLNNNNLEKLPEYFKPWNDLSSRILELMESRTIRGHVDKLELLDHKKLSGEAELQLAHMQLCLFVAGYIWQNGTDDPVGKIPACIAVPFYGVSERLSLAPVMCYCDIIVWNWRPIDPEAPLSLGNFRTIYKLPGGNEADRFLTAAMEIELTFAPAIQRILDAIYATEASDSASLTSCLEDIGLVLGKMTKLLPKYHDLISPNTFFNVLQVYFGGYGPNTPLPEGLVFEGVRDEPVKAMSCSGAQTSTFSLLDAVFGVQHTEGNRTRFLAFRHNMPQGHRRLIEILEQRSRIRQYVNYSGDKALMSAFETCLQGLADFRSYHIKMVAKYFVIPSKGSVPGIQNTMAFLKSMRNESTIN